MAYAIRQDRAGLAAPLSGTLFEGRAAAIHGPRNPLQYSTGNEYRREDQLQSIVDQLPGKPITLLHPNGLIKNGAAAKVVGKVVSARLEDGHAVASIMVHDSVALNAIKHGTHELSLGYACTLDQDRYQQGVDVDHCALVPIARCHTCTLRADAAGGQDCHCGGSCKSCATSYPTDISMADVTLDQYQPPPGPEMPNRLQVTGETVLDKDLSAKERHALPAKHFGVPSREALPLNDEGHVRAAMARFNQTEFKSPAERRAAYHRVLARAHELGIDASGFKKTFGAHMDDAAGGGQGIAQNSYETGMPAPDIHEKLAGLQAQLLSMTAKYDAEKSAHGITKESQLKAEKERDEGNLRAGMFEKEAASHKDRADKAEKDRDTYKAQLDAMRDERDMARKDADEAKTRADGAEETAKAAAEKARLDADAAVQAHIAARADLLTKANQALGIADRTAMNDREIMCAVVKHAHGVEIPGTESNDYVRARFDAAMERLTASSASVAGARQAIQQMRENTDAAPLGGLEAERALQQQMIDRASKAWTSKKN